MKEIGIDLSKHYSKTIENFKDKKSDFVPTVCNKTRKACPLFPRKHVIHKSFENPSSYHGEIEDILKAFRIVRKEIKDWIKTTFCKKDI